jgi:hypothetical protein
MKIDARIKSFFRIAKSYNSGRLRSTTKMLEEGKLGIPIFRSRICTGQPAADGMSQMGIIPTIATMRTSLSRRARTTDEHGQLIQEARGMIVRALVMLIEIVCEHAGIFE